MKLDKNKLLERREVVDEINRHLWLESEKAGYDIGFEKAADDWLGRFSEAWMKYHMPKQKQSLPSTSASRSFSGKRKRSAKSYK